jgi:FKBP12-rapamycin complex-associated protein
MAPDYDHLTLMQKVEVFEHAVNNTAGDDLAKLLWLKSPSSEVCPQTPHTAGYMLLFVVVN